MKQIFIFWHEAGRHLEFVNLQLLDENFPWSEIDIL